MYKIPSGVKSAPTLAISAEMYTVRYVTPNTPKTEEGKTKPQNFTVYSHILPSNNNVSAFIAHPSPIIGWLWYQGAKPTKGWLTHCAGGPKSTKLLTSAITIEPE